MQPACAFGFSNGPQRRQDLSHTYNFSNQVSQRIYSNSTLLSTPKPTPRSLQRIGELCVGKSAQEMKGPPASIIKQSPRIDSKHSAIAVSDLGSSMVPSSPGGRSYPEVQ